MVVTGGDGQARSDPSGNVVLSAQALGYRGQPTDREE